MATLFHLPDIGEGVVEGEITRWLVKAGDEIALNQPFVEVMTDKVTVEIPSPVAGVVLELMAEEGGIVKVGEPMIAFGEAGEQPAATPVVKPPRTTQPVSKTQPASMDTEKASEDILATPAIRQLAKEQGVDLSRVAGTGPQGRITREDVLGFSEESSGETPAPASGRLVSEERVPFRGIRKRTAEKMAQAIAHAAQATYGDEVDVTELVSVRAIAREWAEKEGIHLTYMPFVVRAVVSALKEFPFLNSTVDEASSEIILKKYYNIGIATNTPNGLMVPVIVDADKKKIFELARQIQDLADRARGGSLDLDRVRHGTFTITNVGSVGGIFSTPILNYPEVAILAIHKIVKRSTVVNNHTTVRDMMNIALTFDHRVIDGAEAGRFANCIKQYLEHPGLLLLDQND